MRTKAKDLSRKELQELAAETLKRNPGAEIHFKFTCKHCGERCALEEANVLYESGTCCACGKDTEITEGGFMLCMMMGSKAHASQRAPSERRYDES